MPMVFESSAIFAPPFVLPIAATPTFSPPAGTYSSTQNVVISSTTPLAAIYYTTDGSTPTFPISGTTQLYTGPVSVAVSETLNAIAVAAGFINSPVGSAAYVITSTGTLTVVVDGGLPVPPATLGLQYEIGFTVTNSPNLIAWSIPSPASGQTMSSLSTSRGLLTWPSPTPQGITPTTILATDTVTLATGTITI